jgi:hypothetical protein
VEDCEEGWVGSIARNSMILVNHAFQFQSLAAPSLWTRLARHFHYYSLSTRRNRLQGIKLSFIYLWQMCKQPKVQLNPSRPANWQVQLVAAGSSVATTAALSLSGLGLSLTSFSADPHIEQFIPIFGMNSLRSLASTQE